MKRHTRSPPPVTGSAILCSPEGRPSTAHQTMNSSRLADSLRKDYDYIAGIASDYLNGDNPSDPDIIFALFDAVNKSRETWLWSEPMLK